LPVFLFLVAIPFFVVIFVFTSSKVFQILFGISYTEAITIFSLIVIGSFVNIPIYEKEGKEVIERYYFLWFVYSVRKRKKITIAINLGGCIIPLVLALKLLAEIPILDFLIAFTVSTLVIYHFAKPIPNVGIVVPMFIPPTISAISSFFALLAFNHPIFILPKLSFAVGVLSALFGADILHLNEIEKIGSGVVSIGGAGTFDGIFLTGVFAVIFSFLII